MKNAFPIPLRRLLFAASAAAIFVGAAGCVDTPIIGDDIRVVEDSPHYLRQAYLYTSRDPTTEADENFRLGNCRLYGSAGAGTYYPGCAPGVGERLARRYGTILLPDTSKYIDTDAQEYYRDKATIYAATYNAEMVQLLGAASKTQR